jgi:hypothetical protein
MRAPEQRSPDEERLETLDSTTTHRDPHGRFTVRRIRLFRVRSSHEEMTDHEQCVTGTFGYDGRASWSTSSEGNCWDPEEEDVEI